MENAAAIGYALIAAKAMGFSAFQMKELEFKMRAAMDEFTEDQATDVYNEN